MYVCPVTVLGYWDEVKLLPPATKLGQGYIFTGICDSVQAGCAWLRGGGHAWFPGGVAWLLGGAWLPGGMRGCWGVHGCQAVCVVAGGACVVARGHAWSCGGGMCGCGGDMHGGRRGSMHGIQMRYGQ